jgi:primosomal protein N'
MYIKVAFDNYSNKLYTYYIDTDLWGFPNIGDLVLVVVHEDQLKVAVIAKLMLKSDEKPYPLDKIKHISYLFTDQDCAHFVRVSRG